MKNTVWKLVPGPFNFQRIFCKKESCGGGGGGGFCVVICTNFDSFANTYLI